MKKLIIFCIAGVLFASDIDSVITASKEANKALASIQQEINALDDKTREDFEEYRNTLAKIESMKAYEEALDRLKNSQIVEIASLESQIAKVDETEESISPTLGKMVATLREFVALDLPFLQDERAERLARLEEMLDDATISASEKYRQIIEAYMIENEYGYTIEAYTAPLDDRIVEFLKIGRIGLYYITPDTQEAGYFDGKSFMPLGDKQELIKAIKIAKKENLADLISLPLPAAKDRK